MNADRSTSRRSYLCRTLVLLAATFAAHAAFAEGPQSTPSIFAPAGTPAASIFDLSLFVIAITGGIFVVVAGLLTYAIVRYRHKKGDEKSEPAQVYGSTQIELAWTVVPVLIVVVLFLTTARLIFAIQDAPRPKKTLDVTVIGHQFWWEFHYPKLGIVTANELHIPVSSNQQPQAVFLKLYSADVDHSFWVPQLAGKTDLIPNNENVMWMDAKHPGLYVGQCAQFCGVEHAKMLLRVYADTPEEFAAWVKNQQQAAVVDPQVEAGRELFARQSCMNCHTIKGTPATGHYGPDLTHLMSRETIAAGAAPNTPAAMKEWIRDPDSVKPGALMPAMHLTDGQIDQLVAYLETLH
ncbi:cytochrome c oxidase subunit II [Acidipila rosea]|uniref:Cytochrome c oxidase subunit 2 n=1 Tax=Acidipila rosea TaxID=768535 RepID=A0A4V2PVI8_9BACT|nr:cytochrome c oxidase subunit II [Acidipila rosea]MBW4027263.1 cytochrome c oxidase subunit II [Acidobacteriota bacterium]MBW4046149.1 cytochrome c oxidase subunit II [Acidobacteriota bacterium]TCK74231.1 cytochrome c oxidase subunit 2 [Acidipila rosea]